MLKKDPSRWILPDVWVAVNIQMVVGSQISSVSLSIGDVFPCGYTVLSRIGQLLRRRELVLLE